MNLRSKIFSKVRPITYNGKNLSGDMLLNLAKNYISAINKGIVPNI